MMPKAANTPCTGNVSYPPMMLMNSETKTASPRHPGGEAAEIRDPACAGSGGDDADQNKEQRRVETVRDLLEDGPVQADRVPRCRTQQDEAQSSDRGVGHQRLQI